MQIIRLNVDDHKCLVDFGINFKYDTEAGSSTILIGQNGSGKSTTLQTILEILMSFDSETIAKNISYAYDMEYFYKGSTVRIQQQEKYYHIYIDGELFKKGVWDTVTTALKKAEKSILPERISYFYSGLNDPFRKVSGLVDTTYKKTCTAALSSYWNALYLTNHTYQSNFPKRRYNYCSENLVPVYLLAILLGADSVEKDYLTEQCNFQTVDTVSVVLDVSKINSRLSNDIIETGNEGVCDLLSFIDDGITDLFRKGFLYENAGKFYYELHNLGEVDSDSIAVFNFFEKIDLLLDADLKVYLTISGTRVSCDDLSEGQRQLIKILGMLGVCKSEDTLVLMDEPDAHMNPIWKYELKQRIDECLKNAVNTQALIATHDPLVINGVTKEYIRIFELKKKEIMHTDMYFTHVVEPIEDTAGMGIDGLLQSEYYGLATSYDKPSHKKFIERQELYIKLIRNEASDEEKSRLRELTKEIGMLPMSYNSIDFLYDDFLSVFKKSPLYSKEYLNYDEVLERRREIKEIINALYEAQE